MICRFCNWRPVYRAKTFVAEECESCLGYIRSLCVDADGIAYARQLTNLANTRRVALGRA